MTLRTSGRQALAKWLVPLGAGAIVWLFPLPDGLSPAAWHYTALFIFVVAGLITEPVAAPVIGFIGLCTAAVFQLVAPTPAASVRWALSGFSNDVVWLIFSATTFALGYEITGLEAAESVPGVRVFHAGTARRDGRLVTAGGRVLGVTAVGADVAGAIQAAYDAVGKIHFEGMHYRTDIGRRPGR